ncbi:RNA polymerase sigma-70 like domain-containing protein [Artemisia annua]|uniref:RNA polymerase sigma-70 like domain-containing protein n=1 Tax=Artemisia annua TaxID=35608 RepID=A0A2U1MKC9_ARTAN|nr:RNA polymerase sigma-70 like domain-containing protein [Artemisia annua]
MGLGFRLNLKWGLTLQPRISSNTSSLPSSTTTTCASFKVKDINYNLARVSIPMESENSYNDPSGVNPCSSISRILDTDYSETSNIQRSVGYLLQDDILTFLTSLQANKISQYRLLLENLVVLEDTFADSDVISLERNILVQLEKIGALKFLRTSFSEISKYPINEESVKKPIVHSTRKVERKSQRERMSKKLNGVCTVEFQSQTANHKNSKRVNLSSRRSSNTKRGRAKITRNEAELSRGVKMVANLERIRTMLEEETGSMVSFSSWAAAAGVDRKELLENLQFGWCCRDELLRSTRSLVIYLAKNYNGQGIAFKDLIQAGNVGVLQGAERFDRSRGYKFSTYVQYWIKKSLLMLLSRHAREIRIPFTMSKAISKIQKARKALDKGDGRSPDDSEISKFTGFSLAKIESATKCLRVVGSINRTVGNGIDAKFWEGTPDLTMMTPEETLMKEYMINEMYNRMNDLDAKERTVLILRFGLKGYQRKTLEEIGGYYGVSKEWIRRIETRALTKLKIHDEDTLQSLRQYLYISI